MARRAERRRTVRHPLQVTIEVSVGRDLSFQATRDVSASGAFLERAIPYPVGTRVQLKILLPDGGPPAVCRAEVASVPDAAEVGMGLKFLDISPEDQARIDELGVGQNPDGQTIV